MNIDKIISYEEGNLNEDEVISLFQDLLNSGMCWKLQGFYGRTARDLLKMGLISEPKQKTQQNTKDFYGNTIDFNRLKRD